MSDISEQRRYYERMIDEIAETCREQYEKLQAENAKLRELVQDMWHELDAATQYDAGGGRGVVYEFIDRMSELEVEA